MIQTFVPVPACRLHSFVFKTCLFKNVSIKNLDQNGNAVVELKTEVGSSNVVFSGGTLPIVDPKSSKNLGSISMERTLDGKNILTLTANVTGIRVGNVLTDKCKNDVIIIP